MGTRSMNYIALRSESAGVKDLMNLFSGIEIEVRDSRGILIVYETNIAPMWSRDSKGEHCTSDLELEVAVHKHLGTLPRGDFYMKRAGSECGERGAWAHPFSDEPEVAGIDQAYRDLTTE